MNSDRWERYRDRSPRRAKHRVGGLAALIVALLLLLGVVGLAISSSGLGPRNWLIVLFQINSGVGSLPTQPLRVFNGLDVAILILVALTFSGLWPGPGRRHPVWAAVAVAVPLLGILVLLLTELAGRSSVMLSGIIIAVLMLTGRAAVFLGILGILANVLLLVADFATSDSRVAAVAAVVGVGYILLVAWFVAIGVHLLRGRAAMF
jgi:hypothetical protein